MLSQASSGATAALKRGSRLRPVNQHSDRPIIDQLRTIGDSLGMKVNTDISRHPKVFLRADFEGGSGRMRIKIEMNTFEMSPAFEPIKIPFIVASRWWSGSAEVKTFRIEELIATKIRALYQDGEIPTAPYASEVDDMPSPDADDRKHVAAAKVGELVETWPRLLPAMTQLLISHHQGVGSGSVRVLKRPIAVARVSPVTGNVSCEMTLRL